MQMFVRWSSRQVQVCLELTIFAIWAKIIFCQACLRSHLSLRDSRSLKYFILFGQNDVTIIWHIATPSDDRLIYLPLNSGTP